MAVERFREDGILPEALVNYLALLGWSKDAKTTFLSRDEMIESFDIAHVSRNPAVFDLQKLAWMNGHYIRETPTIAWRACSRSPCAREASRRTRPPSPRRCR